MIKKTLAALTACSLLLTLSTTTYTATAQAAAVKPPQPAYSFSYKLPADLNAYLLFMMDDQTITNPHPEEIRKQYKYSLGQYYEDIQGGYISEKTMYGINFIQTYKAGFIIDLFEMIAVLPPVYTDGYNEAEMNKKISQAKEFTEEWTKLHVERSNKNLQGRVQALINAGYILPAEVEGDKINQVASKEFVANVLYRMYKDIRPYKGSVAPLDSTDTAVRWAIEVGLPGFQVDKAGKVYPQHGLQLQASPVYTGGSYPYQQLFSFVKTLFPAKRVNQQWQYYESSGTYASICYDCLVLVNGKPLNWVTAGKPQLLANKSFKAGVDITIAKLKADINQRMWKLVLTKREAIKKPRIWNWSRDLIHNPKFNQVISHYKKTRSTQALDAVYRAVKQHYHLYPQQDSLAVIKSVLNNVN